MNRRLLFVPLEEIKAQFAPKPARKDIKVIAPKMLTTELFQRLKAVGKQVKEELPLSGDDWRHADLSEANRICESKDFVAPCIPQHGFGVFTLSLADDGPCAVSFANEQADQEAHYHRRHSEIYFSEHSLAADFRMLTKKKWDRRVLDHGG